MEGNEEKGYSQVVNKLSDKIVWDIWGTPWNKDKLWQWELIATKFSSTPCSLNNNKHLWPEIMNIDNSEAIQGYNTTKTSAILPQDNKIKALTNNLEWFPSTSTTKETIMIKPPF